MSMPLRIGALALKHIGGLKTCSHLAILRGAISGLLNDHFERMEKGSGDFSPDQKA
jgi:hypothetical protein